MNPLENKLYFVGDENQIALTNILGQKKVEDIVKSFHTVDMSTPKFGI
jgi:hypothetical protein